MILVFVEHEGGEPATLSLEALTFGRGLAELASVPLEAAVIGGDGRPATDRLAAFGVSAVHVIEHELLHDYAPEAWAKSLVGLLETLAPQAFLAPGSDRGNEIMAHVAARTNLAMAANCMHVEPGEPYTLTRMRWGGSLLEEARLEGRVKLMTVAPHALVPEEAPAPGSSAADAGVTIDVVTPALDARDVRVRVSGRVEPGGDKISLAEARVVVGGGRGVGSAEGFGALEELADLLGGTVGCSRAVTSLGWRSHSDQVGQTGTRIAPDLYIACGISGAIQHMVGCKGAKHMLAINSDPEAPIMAKAEYAVVGDLRTVVPAVVEEIRKSKQV